MKMSVFLRIVFTAGVCAVLLGGPECMAVDKTEPAVIVPECRAVWYNFYMLNVSNEEESKKQIDEHFRIMNDLGINTVMPLVKYTDGTAFYDSDILPRKAEWDCLAYSIKQARKYNMEIHPYINVYCEDGYYLKEHPEYGDLDSAGKPNGWSSPAIEEVTKHNVAVIKELVAKYDIDGVHLDRVRYTEKNMGYNPVSVQKYHEKYNKEPDQNDPDWTQFRRDLISQFVKTAYTELKKVNKNMKFSVAVFHSPKTSIRIMQDWPAWVKEGWMDFITPMSYTATPATFETYVNDCIAAVQGKMPLYIGIGAYYKGMTPELLAGQIDYVRKQNLPGMIYFNAYSFFASPELMEVLREKDKVKAVSPHRVPKQKEFEGTK
ncbi:MAG: family 10 glycosylhydrolase [Elusimicrobiota bacterium]